MFKNPLVHRKKISMDDQTKVSFDVRRCEKSAQGLSTRFYTFDTKKLDRCTYKSNLQNVN